MVCFGVQKIKGKYSQNHDTIWFNPSIKRNTKEQYKFGIIITNPKNKGSIYLYKEKNDPMPFELWVELNEIK